MLTDFKDVKLFIHTPCYGSMVTLAYHASMLETVALLPQHGISIATVPSGGDSLVQRARNVLTAEFLKTDCTHMMCIDADISWRAADLIRLIAADKDISGGVYPKKCYPASWPANMFRTESGILPTCPDTGMIEGKDAPTGFLLIKRGVIEAMIAQHPEWKCNFREGGAEKNEHCYSLFDCFTDDNGMYLSEDFGFCRRAQQAGFRVWIDPTIRLTHTGTHTFDFGCLADGMKRADIDINPAIEGWMSIPELTWLHSTARGMSSVNEIGSWKGRSTYALATGCPGKVRAIDTWQGSKQERAGAHSEALSGNILAQFEENVGHLKNVVTLQVDSLTAARGRKLTADMVFIDAGHTYDEVRADIAAWLPNTKRLICGHDYTDPAWPGVRKAVDEAFPGRVTLPAGSIWAVWLD